MKKFFQLLLDILIILLSVFIIFKLYGNINSKKNGYPLYFGYTYFEIISGSMEDTIHIGDYVFVDTKDKDIKVNDIITFYYEGVIVTHRVINISEDKIITQGDNNNTEDDPIEIANVIGTVKYIGKGFSKLTSVYVIMPLIVILMVINYFLGKEVKIDEEKKEQ